MGSLALGQGLATLANQDLVNQRRGQSNFARSGRGWRPLHRLGGPCLAPLDFTPSLGALGEGCSPASGMGLLALTFGRQACPTRDGVVTRSGRVPSRLYFPLLFIIYLFFIMKI